MTIVKLSEADKLFSTLESRLKKSFIKKGLIPIYDELADYTEAITSIENSIKEFIPKNVMCNLEIERIFEISINNGKLDKRAYDYSVSKKLDIYSYQSFLDINLDISTIIKHDSTVRTSYNNLIYPYSPVAIYSIEVFKYLKLIFNYTKTDINEGVDKYLEYLKSNINRNIKESTYVYDKTSMHLERTAIVGYTSFSKIL